MNYNYRDNYPKNVEAPQRLYLQYSQDIDFDYSNGNYPLGEEHDGFIWENTFNPQPHVYNNQNLERHVWMRWRIGVRDPWTKPVRLTDSFINIESTEPIVNDSTGKTTFQLKYTLANGDVVLSEPITLNHGLDGRGITDAYLEGQNLILSFTDNTTDNVGRVVGYDGNGFDSFGSDIPGNIPFVDENGNLIWKPIAEVLADSISANSPILFDGAIISHLDTDGNKHIPIGGSNGNVLSTDGLGNYSWKDINSDLNNYIPWTAIDDSAGLGDTNTLYSADKINQLLANASAFGIKYSVNLFTDLAGISSPQEGELAVVTSDPLYPNRPVYKYESSNWISFFELDADHNHDDRYYTKVNLSTSGGSSVHWDNITNAPDFNLEQGYWKVSNLLETWRINNGDTLTIYGDENVYVERASDNLKINVNFPEPVTAGPPGLVQLGNVIFHADTSTETDTSNTGPEVIQNLDIDSFGHIAEIESVNLDGRYHTIYYIDTYLYTKQEIDENFYTKQEIDDMLANL